MYDIRSAKQSELFWRRLGHTNQSQLQVGKVFRPGRHLGQIYSQGGLRTSKKLEPNSEVSKTALTDKQISMLDVIPEVLPHFLLRRAFLVHKIATNLYV
jgi:hypothetical protein